MKILKIFNWASFLNKNDLNSGYTQKKLFFFSNKQKEPKTRTNDL